MGVNVPNFGPGTAPGLLRRWAQTVEGLGFDLLMISEHVAVTPDVAEQYPPPFYEPFTTLAWLAGLTDRVKLGTTVLIVPYRHPLLIARMAANLNELSGGRLVLGVGVGWAVQEFDAGYRAGRIPIWVGGNSEAGLRRAVRLGDAWHPLRFTMPWLRGAVDRLTELANGQQRPVPGLVPRIALRLTESPITTPGRLAGEGTIEQILGDLTQLHQLGADTVVLDPFNGDPDETHHPEAAWYALATVSARARHLGE